MTAWAEFKRASGQGFWGDLARRTRGNVSEMARIARVRRSSIYKILQRYGVTLPAERSELCRLSARRGQWDRAVGAVPSSAGDISRGNTAVQDSELIAGP